MTSQARPASTWDHVLTARAMTLTRHPLGRGMASVLAHSGDSIVWLLLGVLLWRLGSNVWAEAGERIVLITALTWVVSTVLKAFFRRPRPTGEVGSFYLKIDRHSFPSGHAVRIGGLWLVLMALLPFWGMVGLSVWGFLVCLSRVALGLHYIADMVAGWLIGAGVGAVLLALL